MKPNAKGFFSCADGSLMDELALHLGLPQVPESVEGDFIAEIYSTPGRIMTSDPSDAYPDEHEDYRELMEMMIYFSHEPTMLVKSAAALGIAEEILEDYMYAADVEPLHEPSDPWED